MNKKGQAAMEFLMTYGWAILVVLAAIAALAYFGVLSPSNLLPERTTFTAPLPNIDSAVISASATGGNHIQIAFRNNAASTINITDSGFNSTGDCAYNASTARIKVNTGNWGALNSSGTTVNNGDTFLIGYNCTTANSPELNQRFKTTATFQFTNTETQLTRPHTGTIEGKVVS
jgi:hypothetical protein